MSCESRMLVPRPASTSSFTAPQSLLSSPKLINVPAPACPLKVAGPLCVPVKVMRRHGAASAGGATAVIQMPPTTAVVTKNRFMFTPSISSHTEAQGA